MSDPETKKPFQLTPAYVFNLLNEAAAGDPGPLTEAIDPEVRWRIGSETQDDVAKTGIFVSSGPDNLILRFMWSLS